MNFFSENTDYLESKYKPQFQAWQSKPTPATTGALLKTLQPEIDRGIFAHVGQSNPLLKSRAKKMTLQALRSYDPTKARLGTHIVNQLQGLKRVSRQQTQILPMPERVTLNQGFIERAKAELAEELGREPNVDEISDRTGLSPKRINYVQKFKYPVSEGFFESMSQEDGDGGFMPAVDQRPTNSWHEFVYSDLDDTNKKIMEWTIGLHGSRPLSNQEIALKLRMTPGAVSQRKAKIQQILDREDLNPFAN